MILQYVAITSILVSSQVFSQEAKHPQPRFNFDLPSLKANECWIAGVDYIILSDMHVPGGYVPDTSSQFGFSPMQAERDKVVITYYFQYTWRPDFEKALKKWADRRDYVQYTYRPSVGWAHTRILARMHYTLQALGHGIDTHFKLYEWVWEPERYRIYHGNPLRPDFKGIDRLNVNFAKSQGIDEKRFLTVYASPDVTFASDLAAHDSHSAGSAGNPGDAAIVINGKYATSGTRVCHREVQSGRPCPDEQDRLLRLIGYLADDEARRLGLRK